MRSASRLETSGRPDTKSRLLDAAERLFAEKGFEGTSLRAVTQAAGASVSAANYHFGSKEALIQAALLRRIEPLNRRRLDALDALESDAGGRAIPVETLVETFVRPVFEVYSSHSEDGEVYSRIAARLFNDPHPGVASLKVAVFQPVAQRFRAAFARALPRKTPEEIAVGFHFMIGLMVHCMMGHLRLGVGDDVPSSALNDEEVFAHMIGFVVAGLQSEFAAGFVTDGGCR